jgi:hypothetical protein
MVSPLHLGLESAKTQPKWRSGAMACTRKETKLRKVYIEIDFFLRFEVYFINK